jgi:hypothetical protein
LAFHPRIPFWTPGGGLSIAGIEKSRIFNAFLNAFYKHLTGPQRGRDRAGEEAGGVDDLPRQDGRGRGGLRERKVLFRGGSTSTSCSWSDRRRGEGEVGGLRGPGDEDIASRVDSDRGSGVGIAADGCAEGELAGGGIELGDEDSIGGLTDEGSGRDGESGGRRCAGDVGSAGSVDVAAEDSFLFASNSGIGNVPRAFGESIVLCQQSSFSVRLDSGTMGWLDKAKEVKRKDSDRLQQDAQRYAEQEEAR